MRTHLPPLMKPMVILCLCLAAASVQSAERVWKDAAGQHEIRAELVSHKDGHVLLKRADGIVITVPLASLSRQDQEFLIGPRQTGETGALMGEQEEIRLEIPKPLFVSSPVVELGLPNMEMFDPSKRSKSFMALKGTVNVAKGKKVTSSDAAPILGDLSLVTDGDANGADGSFVELMPGKQWVQIDLEATHILQKIVVWHSHKQVVAYLDVVIQVSNDPSFKEEITTLWNSDHDNTSGMGKGRDPTYVESNYGRIIEGKAAKARYVRLWSNGNTSNDMNHYNEVMIFAVPAK